MSLKPPRILAQRVAPTGVDAFDVEAMEEKALTLGRLTRAFEQAPDAFAAFEAEKASARDLGSSAQRERLLQAAADALFHFIVQWEVCGLRNTEAVLREYDVPAELRLRMGVARRADGHVSWT